MNEKIRSLDKERFTEVKTELGSNFLVKKTTRKKGRLI